ncbi:MAG: SOS response-associated peptidase [Solobacterium sp.]|nr:SOS response-associated peptidase [Solobacterium sp.]
MCGKYRCLDETNEELRDLAERLKGKLSPAEFDSVSLFEIVPSQKSIAAAMNGKKKICTYTILTWGFPGPKNRLVINARSETAFSSFFFRDSLPCVLPASAYYETDRSTGRKYMFTCSEGTFYLAGLHKVIDGTDRFVILTEEAAFPQSRIHDRQPVIFDYQNAKMWCAAKDPSTFLKYSIQQRAITEI